MKLFGFQAAWGLVDINPFVMKVENVMRFFAIEHSLEYQPTHNHSPTGLLPYFSDGPDVICDSDAIIAHLNTSAQLNLDSHLSASQKSIALLMKRVVQEHLYPIMLFSRMIDPSGLALFKQTFFDNVTDEALKKVTDNISNKLSALGVDCADAQKVYALGLENIAAIDTLYSGGSYFFGEQLSSIDAVLLAFLSNISYVPIENPLSDYIAESLPLKTYINQMMAKYYGS